MDFDAWIAGRSAALTRFAYLLTGSEVAAERALAAALTVACATWSRVRRSDDPEAQVQQLVVEAHLPRGRLLRRRGAALAVSTLPSDNDQRDRDDDQRDDEDDPTRAWRLCAGLPAEQRAAVVLRCYSEMTYPQIAVVMGGKESVAQAHVERSFQALRVAIGERRSDLEIEAAFREAFAEHGEDPVDPGDRAPLAHAGARRRRRRMIVPAVAAAVLLVAGLGAVAISYDGGDQTASAKPRAGEHPRGWRAESYNGIQLWVPSAWGWGQVPRLTSQGLVSCGLNAYSPTAVISGARYALRGYGALPYVGRPAEPDAGCGAPPSPMGAHVWFDSPLPTGSGPAQTTVRVAGVTSFNITVADPNQAERAQILASIEQVAVDAHGCPRGSGGIRRLEALAVPEPSPRMVRTVSLCLFTVASKHQQSLFYSTQVDGADARQSTAQIEAAPAESPDSLCLITPALKQVVLIVRTPQVRSVFGVNAAICPQDPVGYVTGSSFHILTAASMRLWDIDGLSLYAGAGVGERLSPFLPSR